MLTLQIDMPAGTTAETDGRRILFNFEKENQSRLFFLKMMHAMVMNDDDMFMAVASTWMEKPEAKIGRVNEFFENWTNFIEDLNAEEDAEWETWYAEHLKKKQKASKNK